MSPTLTLDCMPREIHHYIISALSSCRDDIKALRQTSRRFADICAAHLFVSVHVSALKRDWDCFLQVASSPHLACHVHTLVWEEFTGDFHLFEPEALQDIFDGNGSGVYTDWDEERVLLEDLAAQSKALFWLTSDHARAEMRRRKTISGNSDASGEPDLPLWNEFVQATSAFHNVFTFVSRPMYPDRELQPAAEGCYPLTARVVLQYLHHNRRPLSSVQSDTIFNIGFLFYLVPLLNLHCERGDLRIKNLSFSDESVIKSSALGHLTEKDANAFSNISHLELKVTEKIHDLQDPLSMDVLTLNETGLATYLTKAAKLTSIHLSCDEVASGTAWDGSPDAASTRGSLSLSMIPTLPALRCASFENVNFTGTFVRTEERDNLSNGAQPALVDFVKRHASTLLELQVLGSLVTEMTICQLAADPHVRLNRLVISTFDQDSKPSVVLEPTLLAIVNTNYGLDIGLAEADAPRKYDMCTQLSTHHPSPDRQDWRLTAMNWSLRQRILQGQRELREGRGLYVHSSDPGRGEESHEPELPEHCRTLQPVSGLWKDANGVLYDPRTDSILPIPTLEGPPRDATDSDSEEWKIQNGRRWNSHLGLWSDLSPSEAWRLYKNSEDRGYCEAIDGDGLGLHGKLDKDLAAASSNGICEWPTYSQQFCLNEDFEQVVRLEHGAKWRYGRDRQGTVWYWQVYDMEISGYKTERWRFEHRNGQIAYGSDPLDFWDDWEGYQYGDDVQPTPFSNALWAFAKHIPRPWETNMYIKGWPIPKHNEIGSKFSPLVEYKVDVDSTDSWSQ